MRHFEWKFHNHPTSTTGKGEAVELTWKKIITEQLAVNSSIMNHNPSLLLLENNDDGWSKFWVNNDVSISNNKASVNSPRHTLLLLQSIPRSALPNPFPLSPLNPDTSQRTTNLRPSTERAFPSCWRHGKRSWKMQPLWWRCFRKEGPLYVRWLSDDRCRLSSLQAHDLLHRH